MSPTPLPRHRHGRHLSGEQLENHLEDTHHYPITSTCYEGVLEHIHNLLHAGKTVEFMIGRGERY